MNRQTADKIGHTDDESAAPASVDLRESAVGVLGAVMPVLSAAGQAKPSESAPVFGATSQTQAGVVERFEDVRARLRQSCANIDFSSVDGAAGKPNSQLCNWTDW